MRARAVIQSTAGRGRWLALAAAVGLAGQVAAAEPDAALGALMQQLAARRHGHARFVERQYLAILDRPLEASGELYYDAPDRLEKRTERPRAERLVLDHGLLDIRRGAHVARLPLSEYPQLAPLLDSIRAALAGDLPALERNYTLTFAATDGDWTLQLAPRAAAISALIARIRLRGAADQIREFAVDWSNGDRSVMTISALPEP